MSTSSTATTTDLYAGLQLRLLPLEITVRWQRPTHIPGEIVANVLRGAFNLTFRRLVCPPDFMRHECQPCLLYATCPYGQIFEPSPPADADRLRKQSDLPRPFVLKPPLDPASGAASARRAIEESDPRSNRNRNGWNAFLSELSTLDSQLSTLSFGLVLFGRAIDYLPHFVVTLTELGRTGMGPQRVPFEIAGIEAVSGQPSAISQSAAEDRLSGSPLSALGSPPSSQPLYDPATHQLRRPTRFVTEADLCNLSEEPATSSPTRRIREHYLETAGMIEPHAASPSLRVPASQLTVRFLTPTLLRTGSGVGPNGERIPAREVRERPDFGTIVRRLRDRLAALSAFFGYGPWAADFTHIGRLADEVRLVHSDTQWLHRTRRSTRTGQSHELSGLIGQATYEFPTPTHRHALLPLLRFGELFHLGKHAVWGNGWFRVEDVS